MRLLLLTLAIVVTPALAAPPAPRLIGPRSGAEREKALKKNGGTKKTEEIVARGLDWLARHQASNGGWDADGFASKCKSDGKRCDGKGKGQHGEAVPCPFDHAISALATLAFLGHGHLPGVEGDPYAKAVEKALARLDNPRDVWALALSTQAFAEAEAMEGKGRYAKRTAALAASLLGRRQKDGGWGYAAGFRPGSDVPYTALVVQALVAARDAGVKLPADFESGVDRYLSSLEEKGGRLAYLLNGRAYGYTPTTSNAHCAVAIRELIRTGTTGKRHRAHVTLVLKQKPVWKISFRTVEVPGRGKVPVQIGNLSMYQWWYGTIGLFHKGGGDWSAWFGKVKTALVKNQRKDGCAKGSWDPKGTYERQTGGRVFATALGVLMLEQPYRHRRIDK